MATQPKSIYLAKAGKIEGPFRASEFERIKKSGTLSRYSWIWNESAQAWDALDPAPKSPPHKPQIFEISNSIDVVCHNFVDALAGRLQGPDSKGGEILTSISGRSDSPQFRKDSLITLQLLDCKNQLSENARVRITNINRASQGWIYEFDWLDVPILLGT